MDDRPLNPYAEALKYLKRANDLIFENMATCNRLCLNAKEPAV